MLGCDCLIDLLGILDCRTFSFETDEEGWQACGTDLSDPPVEWSVRRTTETAEDGVACLRFFLNNLNDAGKIWVERPFDVKPNRRYRVTVSYAFGTADFGEVNLWRIITGVAPAPPTGSADLMFQDSTGSGSDSDEGYRWLEKSYSFDVPSGPDGVLYVTIGVWGTWETPRTYYVDGVRVCLRERW